MSIGGRSSSSSKFANKIVVKIQNSLWEYLAKQQSGSRRSHDAAVPFSRLGQVDNELEVS